MHVLILQNYSTEVPNAMPCTPYYQEPSTYKRSCFRAFIVANRKKVVDGPAISMGARKKMTLVSIIMCATIASRDMHPLEGDWGVSVSI